MPMQQYAVKEINRFREEIAPFRDLWGSVLVRGAWTEILDHKRMLALSITLEQKEAKQLARPKSAPEIGRFRIAWEAFGVSELDKLLDNLSEGFINIEGNKILVERHDNSAWSPWHSLSLGFSRAGEYPYGIVGKPVITLFGSESMNSSVYEGVMERDLAHRMKALKYPYDGVADVVRDCLGISNRQQDQLLVSIKAEVPIALEVSAHKQRGRHNIKIVLPKLASAEKVSVGVIETCHDGRINRSASTIKASYWRVSNNFLMANFPISFDKDAVKVLLLLSYDGVFLGQNSLVLFPAHSNPVVKMHACMDPDYAIFMRSVSGQGKDPGHDFEQGVAWLFSFCGFQSCLYGLSPQLGETAVDVLAYSREEKVVLAIECGVSHSQTQGKLPRFLSRCRKLSESLKSTGIKVLPVFATALDEVSKSMRTETFDERVALLMQKDLLNIFQLAVTGKSLKETLAYITSILRNEPRFRN